MINKRKNLIDNMQKIDIIKKINYKEILKNQNYINIICSYKILNNQYY